MRPLTQNKTNWNYIVVVFIVAIIIGGEVIAWQHLSSQKEITESLKTETQKGQKAKWAGSRIVRMEAKTDESGKEKIIFSTLSGEKISEIRVEEVSDPLNWGFEGVTGGPSWRTYGTDGKAIEVSPGLFYFFRANTAESGQIASLYLFKYNSKTQVLNPIKVSEKEGELGYFGIGGHITNYYLSPDKGKVAVKSIASGGVCYNSEDIDVISLKESKYHQYHRVSKAAFNQKIIEQLTPESGEYHMLWMNFLNWLDSDCFKLCLTAESCKEGSKIRGGLYKYCVSTEKLELIDSNIPKECLDDIQE